MGSSAKLLATECPMIKGVALYSSVSELHPHRALYGLSHVYTQFNWVLFFLLKYPITFRVYDSCHSYCLVNCRALHQYHLLTMQSMVVAAQMTVDPTSFVCSVHLSPHECAMYNVVVPFNEKCAVAVQRHLLRYWHGELIIGVKVPVIPRRKFGDKFCIVAFWRLPCKRYKIE